MNRNVLTALATLGTASAMCSDAMLAASESDAASTSPYRIVAIRAMPFDQVHGKILTDVNLFDKRNGLRHYDFSMAGQPGAERHQFRPLSLGWAVTYVEVEIVIGGGEAAVDDSTSMTLEARGSESGRQYTAQKVDLGTMQWSGLGRNRIPFFVYDESCEPMNITVQVHSKRGDTVKTSRTVPFYCGE